MNKTLIEKLEALQRYDYVGVRTEPIVYYDDLRAIIEEAKKECSEKQVIETHNGYIEGTAERLRLICSKLGIGAPVSNEEIMFCQFSLLGAIRRKIDALYTAPQPAIIEEAKKEVKEYSAIYEQDTSHLPELLDTEMAKGWRWMRKDFKRGDKLYAHPSPAIIAELVKALDKCVYVMEHTLIAERQALRVYEDWDKSLTEVNAILARAKTTF